jgi:hypothetical protein
MKALRVDGIRITEEAGGGRPKFDTAGSSAATGKILGQVAGKQTCVLAKGGDA